ncbi:hypothetical protein A2U01_0084451, partial [Trifolium medium]|nr:hypothetical protein [Trifolium medium]
PSLQRQKATESHKNPRIPGFSERKRRPLYWLAGMVAGRPSPVLEGSKGGLSMD